MNKNNNENQKHQRYSEGSRIGVLYSIIFVVVALLVILKYYMFR